MATPESHLPVDTNVVVPASVRQASANADAIHAQVYQPPAPPAQQADAVPPAPPAPPPANVTATVTPAQPAEGQPPAQPIPESGEQGSWEHRYHSMKGRYDQQANTVGQLQEQLAQLGDEMVRLQDAFATRETAPRPNAQQSSHRRLTAEDMQHYGPDLIEFVQRAALDAVKPELDRTGQQVAQVAQAARQSTALTLYQQLDRDVPNWRAINVDPQFISWCRSPDVYSGQVRGTLLKAAFQAANAPRVVAFFNGFLAEQRATGQAPALQNGQQPPAPAQPAVALDALVAPGRAKPAPGNTEVAADKPYFTRAQISAFYNAVRQGLYAGRDTEKAQHEQMIFDAQREGRVKG